MSNYLIEYMKIHLVSIEQDQEDVISKMEGMDPNCKDYAELDFEYNWLAGQITATQHFIKVGEEHARNS